MFLNHMDKNDYYFLKILNTKIKFTLKRLKTCVMDFK